MDAWQVAARVWRDRPLLACGLAGVGLALLVGLISCQTAGGRVAGSMPSEPEVRIRIRTGLASTKLSGDGVMRVR
ncbi:MAG: hypothetical protein ACKVW3_01665, partial [Phycisphaerales bacterium]